MTKPDFINNPLDTLYSCRIRLNDEQRAIIRRAHQEFRKSFAPTAQQPVMAGSTVSVVTNQAAPHSAYAAEGLSDIVVADLCGTRDTIALALVLKLERLLDIKIIKRKDLEDKFQRYLDYLQVS